MSNPSKFWADHTTLDFSNRLISGLASKTIAVLPVAATEQHGPHLPLSVDTVLVNGIIACALTYLPPHSPVLFLPTQNIGLSPEHAGFAGTLTLRNETVIRVWTDIAESVAAAGVRKLIILNAHGGQVSVMDLVARDLRARLNMLVYSVSWFNLPLLDQQGQDIYKKFTDSEHRFGIHAGEMETSMMLSLAPLNVDMTKAENFISSSQHRAENFKILGDGKSTKFGWQIQDYNLCGAVGNAAAATPEKGQSLVEAAGFSLSKMLEEVGLLPDDTLVSSPLSRS